MGLNLTLDFARSYFSKLEAIGFGQSDLEKMGEEEQAKKVLLLLRGITTPKNEKGMGLEAQLARWQGWYMKHFGLMFALSMVKLPERKKGFDRLIVVHPGITYAKLVDFLRTKFNVYLYTEDLDADIIDCCRAQDEPYAIWVRARKEADKENRNKSANQFSEERGETLLERLLHEISHFLETGEHLDFDRWTICAGSRDQDGDVPIVFWSSVNGQLYVRRGDVGSHCSNSAVRSVVR